MTLCSFRQPSTWHAVVAVFLQFFSWGLITAPMITMLNTTFGVSNDSHSKYTSIELFVSEQGIDDERRDHGCQGVPQLPLRPTDWLSVRCLGPQAVSSDHSALHLPPHTISAGEKTN